MDVPEDYNRHRYNETWREKHGWSKRARQEAKDLTKTRRRNREPGRFGKVNWDAYQHDQLFDMIMKANLGEMSSRANQWGKLAAKIESTTGEVQRVMERVMTAWHGTAAVSAGQANTRLMQWAGDAGNRAGKIAEGMSTYTDAVNRAQNHMPNPAFDSAERNFREGYTVTGTGGPSTAILLKQLLSDGMVSHEQARARKAEAVQVMETYESQSKDVHDTMPHFTDTPPTTNGDGEPGGTPTPDQDYEGSGRPVPPLPPTTPVPSTDPGGSTTAAGYVDPRLATAGQPGLGGPGGLGGGPGGTGYGGGLGSLGSGGSDVVRNSPGFGGLAGTGPFAAGRGPAGAGGLLGGARGAAGAGGFGGMPVGHGAQGEEDTEHKNKYDEGMDFFDDLPPAYPSVFGA